MEDRTTSRGRLSQYNALRNSPPAPANLKEDLVLRPIFHQLEHRIEAHISIAFMAYCLQVTLRARLRPLAPRTELTCCFWTNLPPFRCSTCTSDDRWSLPDLEALHPFEPGHNILLQQPTSHCLPNSGLIEVLLQSSRSKRSCLDVNFVGIIRRSYRESNQQGVLWCLAILGI